MTREHGDELVSRLFDGGAVDPEATLEVLEVQEVRCQGEGFGRFEDVGRSPELEH